MTTEKKILLVDDEQRILESYSLLLGDLGYDVRSATNAVDACLRAEETDFAIAFIDQFLGDDRGLELVPRLRAIRPDLSCVIMTANGSADLAVEALKGGAADFVVKPFLVADLVKSIEYVNRQREMERQKKAFTAMLEGTIRKKTRELQTVYFSVLSSLAQAMEQKDQGTFGHSRRVSYYTRLIAAALDLPEDVRENLKNAALLHDIGKIGTSDFILGKEGTLTPDEVCLIRSHPQKGVEILKPLADPFSQMDYILPAILHHHENWDGSGYPAGLAGETIPLLSRIIAVADAYDAIMSDRPYRAKATHEQAVAELARCAGIQFDPFIVRTFLETDAKCRRAFVPSPAMSGSRRS